MTDVALSPALEHVISILVPREGHDRIYARFGAGRDAISILVPREGHDQANGGFAPSRDISILVPREGHDRKVVYQGYPVYKFQSSCPVRGTTPSIRLSYTEPLKNFNPRAP